MGEPLLTLSDAAHWEVAFEEDYQADPGPSRSFYPIQSVIVPVLFSSPYLVLNASSSHALPHWKLGYYARQFLGMTGIGAIESTTRKSLLNRAIFAQYPLLQADYQLRLDIPHWHRSISVRILQYIGPIDNTSDAAIREQHEIVRIDLLQIRARLDQQ